MNGLGTVGDSFEKAGKADAGITLEYVRQWMRNNRTASRFDKVWASVHSAPTRMHSAGHSEPPEESNTNRFATTINHASGKLRKTLADVLHKIAIVVNFNIYIYIYIRYTYVFLLSAASFTPSFTQPSTADQTSQHHQPWRPLYSWRCKGFQSRIQGELICRICL